MNSLYQIQLWNVFFLIFFFFFMNLSVDLRAESQIFFWCELVNIMVRRSRMFVSMDTDPLSCHTLLMTFQHHPHVSIIAEHLGGGGERGTKTANICHFCCFVFEV